MAADPDDLAGLADLPGRRPVGPARRVEPPDDPILLIRPHVHAESVRRRTGG